MNYLRPLVTRAIETFKGRNFPRRVTAPDGSIRWESVTGRSFATIEEALKA
jgi:hypothetical protein